MTHHVSGIGISRGNDEVTTHADAALCNAGDACPWVKGEIHDFDVGHIDPQEAGGKGGKGAGKGVAAGEGQEQGLLGHLHVQLP